MDPITTAAASGMRARAEALDMLANNIANAGTAGFKRDGEFYGQYEDAEAAAFGIGTSVLPVIDKPWTDHSQGTLNPTGRPTDLALSGSGFFAVNGPSGTLYTRNGNFRQTPTGLLVTQEGLPVRAVGGGTLQLQPGAFEVTTDGGIRQNGVVVGRLEVADFPTNSLIKQGAALFRPAVPNAAVEPARAAEIHQGKLESANVSVPESAVRLVNLMRQFEALQKAIGIGGEMGRKAIEEVARVGQ